MRYFKLMYDYERSDDYVNCNVGKIGQLDEYVISNGKVIDEWNEVVFEYNSNEGGILTDFVSNLYRWLIVSCDFIDVTQQIVQNQVQYLPIKLVDSTTNVKNDLYYVANVINIVDAFDLEKSRYDIFELDDEKIISVEKYVLKQKKIGDSHIFRLKNDTIPVFVSETIKELIEANKLLGFAFLEVDVN